MSAIESRVMALIGVGLLGVAALWACSVNFGISLLGARRDALLHPPAPAFLAELSTIVPKPKDNLKPVDAVSEDDVTTESIEVVGLPPKSVQTMKDMRAKDDGDEAYEVGEGLPESIRHYTAGAVAFLQNNLDRAAAHFHAVLQLNSAQRRDRELWARYMLGRIAVQRKDDAAAIEWYQSCRAAARNGLPDPLSLAISSLGQEARVYWNQGRIRDAVVLYAQQAAYGSESGRLSLITVSKRIINNDHWLDEAIQDDVTRRMLFLCLDARNPQRYDDDVDDSEASEPQQASNEPTPLDRILSAVERHDLSIVSGAGLLASTAYLQGRFDVAGQFAARENTPIALWVRAKLALRNGDMSAALAAYDGALKNLRANPWDNYAMRRVEAESGVLRVSRGDYKQALNAFLDAASFEPGRDWDAMTRDYWQDAAYIAERVLTVEELRGFVDEHLPSPRKGSHDESPAGSQLRAILARRLMRAGHYDEALRYFDDEAIRSAAVEYVSAVNTANSWWRRKVTRAEAWFNAATIARFDGMELLAFELGPDSAITSGEFPFFGPEPSPDDSDQGAPADSANQHDLMGADEDKRVASSEARPNVRFHYRVIAVQNAMKAADLLPHSSQAFAAVLCAAYGWAEEETVYARYLKEGPYVSWSSDFGRRCPPPDFGGASFYALRRVVPLITTHLRTHPVLGASLGVLAVVLLGMPAIALVRRAKRAGFFKSKLFRVRGGALPFPSAAPAVSRDSSP